MPKRTDINCVLLIGAGPIVIGQACEFDYSGSQACRALREDNVRIVLLNSNPATIMTDPDLADATYLAPITPASAEEIINREQVDAILPTMGGQTALNCAMQLHSNGALDRLGVELIGADTKAIRAAEDRDLFRKLMTREGLETARAARASSLAEAWSALAQIGGLPAVVRPSFTLGGSGGGIAYNREEFAAICTRGLAASPVGTLLVEESLRGWKEFELEVVRDRADNCIVVCGIENVDPVGVHTGDSITVAPIQTLTDKEYQRMRSDSFKVIRAIGVDTGGANVQFAVDPKTGRQLIIEMNPRVSRSSALASKATGFPIAKVSTKLALGYTLDELRNEITGGRTPASFEPSIDYIVCKLPRFDFAKFPGTHRNLGTEMRSVGEVMALGRSFCEALHKALRSLEIGISGLAPQVASAAEALAQLAEPKPETLLLLADALRYGAKPAKLHSLTGIDPWFIGEIAWLVSLEQDLAGTKLAELDNTSLLRYKREGFADARLAELLGCSERDLRARRQQGGLRPVFKRIDSCAAEFPTETAYLYSTYEEECEAEPSNQGKILILGAGPNRIGQGIEFDYCCIHASLALKEHGFETIMVNCNPETVSTDYDMSSRLYFEPLTTEDVLEIIHVEKPCGVIVQMGGQTPLAIAAELAAAGVPIIGTPVDAIDRAEDRDRFRETINRCGLIQPQNAIATSAAEARKLCTQVSLPLVVRPSYVLGGKAMEVIHTIAELDDYFRRQKSAVVAAGILLDRFLIDAVEVDVDAVCDGKNTVIVGILEHIERAGIHSGDSAATLPPHSLSEEKIAELKSQTRKLAREVGTIGLMNVQYAIKDDTIYVLEVNPRASRTVPFISKATGYQTAKIGALAMVGISLAKQNALVEPVPAAWHVKEAVFPFERMPGTELILGPEMKSTGEVMGIASSFHGAFLRATQAVTELPKPGMALLSVCDKDKPAAISIAKILLKAGFTLAGTPGTAAALENAGLTTRTVKKVNQGRPNVIDLIKDGMVSMVINSGGTKRTVVVDSGSIRTVALACKVLYFTTIDGAMAAATGFASMASEQGDPLRSLQDLVRRD